MSSLTVSEQVRKVLSVYLVPYLLVLLSISVALHPIWLKQFPTLNLYKGDLFFSGERAYADLTNLVEQFPSRVAGSESGQLSAEWMADAFRRLGLQVSLETFETYAPENVWDSDLFLAPVEKTHRKFTGTNVVAISPGQTPVTVLIMANRDHDREVTLGAVDNASGNAALLELARILSTSAHFYTYLFVSTDALNIGSQGSEYLARNHPELPLRLAIALDDVGYAQADTVGLYNYGNGRQSSPLWTVALAHDVLETQGLASEAINANQPWAAGQAGSGNPVSLLAALLSQRGLGARTVTDTDVFLERGNPILGISAVELIPSTAIDPFSALAGSGGVPAGEVVSAQETLARVSVDKLQMSGRFIEQYVRSLELNQFDSALLSRFYVVFEGQYLPAGNVTAFGALIQAAFVLLALLPFFEPPVVPHKFFNFFERELSWLLRLTLLALAAGGVWQLMRLEMFRFIPPVLYLALSFAIVINGGLRVLRQRRHYLMLWRFDPTVAHQRRVLVLLLLFFYLAFNSLFSPFTAAALLFIPFLVWAAIRYHTEKARRVWLAIFCGWTLVHALFSILAMYTAVSRTPPWEFPGFITWTLSALLWLVVMTYVFSTPPLGVVERK